MEITKVDEKQEEQEKASTLCKCCFCSISRIVSPFSNITTSIVLKRILSGLIPIKKDFLTSLENKPDIYGPFWIYATIIFCLAAAGNLSQYIQSTSSSYTYDFSYLAIAFFLVYALGFSIPILLYCILRINGVETIMTECICIYGYGMFVFIPISFLCVIDNDYLKWAFIGYGAFSTILFISLNYWPRFTNVATRNKYTIIILLIIMQLILFILFKYYFFESVYSSSSSSTSTASTVTVVVVTTDSSDSTTNSTTTALQISSYLAQMYRIKS